MESLTPFLEEHRSLTRRYFLGLGLSGLAAGRLLALQAGESDTAGQQKLRELIDQLEYFTPPAEFRTVERGNPLPYTLPPDELRAAGLTRETWTLEVVADEETEGQKPQLVNPLSKERGTALTFEALMQLAETRAVRFPKIMTCNNIGAPLGVGLWEGVPLREVVWMTQPKGNVRRLFYHGFHNHDPKQLFQSSLSIGRVLEDPPELPPVILCYKLNGEWLSGKRGGPVRIIVPEAYGFKSVKWLTRVTLSNLFHANDTYAGGNNDIDSWLKTFARFVSGPKSAQPNEPIPLTGFAQVGISGMKSVEVSVTDASKKWPDDDPYFQRADWQSAEILAPPTDWGGGLPGGKLPLPTFGFDSETGKPKDWPRRLSAAHWAILLPGLPTGEYDIRCRTIDANNIAQPLPRPFRKSGRNAIESFRLRVA